MNDDSIQKNRLWNTRQVIKSCGGTNAAAAILGVRAAYVTAIAGPNPNRTIGNRMATKIETCFGLPPGSIDMDPPSGVRDDDPFLSEIAATLANTTDEDKEFVLAISQWIVSRSSAKLSATNRIGKIDLAIEAESLNPPLLKLPNKQGTKSQTKHVKSTQNKSFKN